MQKVTATIQGQEGSLSVQTRPVSQTHPAVVTGQGRAAGPRPW